ncbi:hypothetical protein TRVL_05069 [Trypanosoma vivax]|nr:hypothetical protein TRVL_05069 [Trypanosoma vivax]
MSLQCCAVSSPPLLANSSCPTACAGWLDLRFYKQHHLSSHTMFRRLQCLKNSRTKRSAYIPKKQTNKYVNVIRFAKTLTDYHRTQHSFLLRVKPFAARETPLNVLHSVLAHHTAAIAAHVTPSWQCVFVHRSLGHLSCARRRLFRTICRRAVSLFPNRTLRHLHLHLSSKVAKLPIDVQRACGVCFPLTGLAFKHRSARSSVCSWKVKFVNC